MFLSVCQWVCWYFCLSLGLSVIYYVYSSFFLSFFQSFFLYFFQSFFLFISFNLSFRLKPDVPNHPVWQYLALSVCSINKSKKKFRIGEKTPSTSLSDSIDLIQNFEIDIGGQEISNAIRFWHLDQSCISKKNDNQWKIEKTFDN